MALQIEGLSKEHSIEVAEKLAEEYREQALKGLGFDTLGCIELALIRVYTLEEHIAEAATGQQFIVLRLRPFATPLNDALASP